MKKSQIFNVVPVQKPKRSFFDLSHEVKMSGKFSYLYPVFVQETLPGDTFRNTSTIFMRLAPMLAPIMHRLDVTTHFFFVPYRLCTDAWEPFITGGQTGEDVSVLPFFTPAEIANEGFETYMEKRTLWDYLGLPVTTEAAANSSTEEISALPFIAYTKIWNDYYRDPNFDTEIPPLGNSGNVSSTIVGYGELRRRAWSKDYFTSCLPWAQRGESVLIPMTGVASDADGDISWKSAATFQTSAGANFSASNLQIVAGSATEQAKIKAGAGTPEQGRLKNIDTITWDNQEITINDLRTSLAIQRWLENNARGGARYIEQIMSHFGVRVQDYRLQRAEYLGGGKQPVQISEVLATAKTEVDASVTPVGDLSGHGISVGKSNQFTYRCTEHGIILGIMSVMPQPAYQQGIDRMWSRKERFDFAFPELAHLGEQEVLSKEVFYSFLAADDAANNSTFGYIPRYAEYKFKLDRVAGDFRDNLQYWHLGRFFTSRPTLSENFTTADESGDEVEEGMRRIFAVQTEDDYLWIQIFHRCGAKRPLPYFGVPKLLG